MSQEQQDIADLKAWRKVVEPMLTEIHHDVKKLVEASSQRDCVAHGQRISILEGDVTTLKMDKSALRGGWLALAAIGSVLMLLASIVGSLAAWLALKH